MSESIVVRRPQECSTSELTAFVATAAKGEEVGRADIERGVQRAALLLWMERRGSPFAVAALKTPLGAYKERIFRKAGIPEMHEKFILELGYIYVDEAKRGNGFGRALVKKALALHKEGIYATSRADNNRMKDILTENGFYAVGLPYKSERSDSRLVLHVRALTF